MQRLLYFLSTTITIILFIIGRCSKCYGPGEDEYLSIQKFQQKACTPEITYGKDLPLYEIPIKLNAIE